jgi:hypothetical protein
MAAVAELEAGMISARTKAPSEAPDRPSKYRRSKRKEKKAMAKAYKHQRQQRTQRRLKNQNFMEPSKRPLTGKRKKSFIRSLLSKDASERRRAAS